MNICPPAVKRLKQEDFTNAKPRHRHTLPHYSHVILLVLCLQLRLSDSFSDDTLSRNIHAEQTSCGEPERNTSSQRSLLMSMSVENKSYHDVILKTSFHLQLQTSGGVLSSCRLLRWKLRVQLLLHGVIKNFNFEAQGVLLFRRLEIDINIDKIVHSVSPLDAFSTSSKTLK